MPAQQTQLDPLPLPETKEVEVTPAPNYLTGGLPPSAGWVPKAGAGAYIASNVLNGWMAGRHMAQQRKLEKAKNDVTGSKSLYDAQADAYKNVVEQGLTPEAVAKLDPNKPEDKAKLDTYNNAKKNVLYAYNHYLDQAQKYSTPDEGEQKKTKGQKIKSGLHDAFMGQDPQMFVDASLKALRQTGPPILSYGTSQEEKLRQKSEEQQVQINEQHLKDNANKLAAEADEKALRQQYEDSLKKGDNKTSDQLRLQYENLTGKKLTTPAQQKTADDTAAAADKLAQAKISAIDKLASGKGNADLTDLERDSFGVQQGPLDFYLAKVGKPGGYKDQRQAYQAFLNATASAQAIAGNSAVDRQWKQVLTAQRSVLEHELTTPEGARKWGLPAPLKPGETIPPWIVNKAALERMKASPEDRAAAKVNVDKSLNASINAALRSMPAGDQEKVKAAYLDFDEGTKTYSLKPYTPKEESHWFGMGKPTIGGISKDEYDQKRQDFLGRVASYVRKLYPDASQDRIIQALNSPDAAEYLTGGEGGGTPSTGLTPPPVGGRTTPLGEKPTMNEYVVTDPQGKKTVISMTDEEAGYMRSANQSFKIEEKKTSMDKIPIMFPAR